jgi:hypothetical protein
MRTQIAQKMGPNHSNNDLEEQMSKEFDLVFNHLQQDGVFACSIWLSFIGVMRLQIHVSILEMGLKWLQTMNINCCNVVPMGAT